jgi:hypothetical protein
LAGSGAQPNETVISVPGCFVLVTPNNIVRCLDARLNVSQVVTLILHTTSEGCLRFIFQGTWREEATCGQDNRFWASVIAGRDHQNGRPKPSQGSKHCWSKRFQQHNRNPRPTRPIRRLRWRLGTCPHSGWLLPHCATAQRPHPERARSIPHWQSGTWKSTSFSPSAFASGQLHDYAFTYASEPRANSLPLETPAPIDSLLPFSALRCNSSIHYWHFDQSFCT